MTLKMAILGSVGRFLGAGVRAATFPIQVTKAIVTGRPQDIPRSFVGDVRAIFQTGRELAGIQPGRPAQLPADTRIHVAEQGAFGFEGAIGTSAPIEGGDPWRTETWTSSEQTFPLSSQGTFSMEQADWGSPTYWEG